MANSWLPKGREHFALGEVDWVDDTIKAVFVDTDDHTPDDANDESLADITGAARVDTTSALTGQSATNGTLDAADTSVAGVTGDQFERVYVFKDSGVEATSWLLFYYDTATGLPFTPAASGSDTNVTWPSPMAVL